MSALLSDLAIHQRIGNTTPFVLGRMDCSLWAADWVLRQTGVDLAASWRGTYGTEREYMRLLLAEGGLVRVAATAMTRLGARRVAPADARAGDVGIIVTERGPALAIRGQLAWMAKTGDQLSTTPDASFAWRI
ncbi:hypothetical protein AB4Z01_25640 [Inquilinus sp. YAF38]|uniref:DUF6950 family protein n=1 Tax=Inquilinus sp. YAF38 TaxID=3233084 RepID=UPI003F904ADA